jgi:uncharacterized protein YkwD
MKHRLVHTLVAMLCLATVVLPSFAASPASAASYSPSSVECQFLHLINNYRAQHGLSSLKLKTTLGAAARHHSSDMATHNYLSHTLYNGASAHQNMLNYSYPANTYWGENIYAGYGRGSNGVDNSSAQGAFNWWKNSPGHNANMLNSHFKAIGIGRAYNSSSTYKYYWTTDFGSYVGATISC